LRDSATLLGELAGNTAVIDGRDRPESWHLDPLG
jgi:hypothetical protein